jgi:formylmethanofuran dehydrogenase subunit E
MVNYYLKIGDEIFKMSFEDLEKAIEARLVEEEDQVYSPTATEGFWKKVKDVEKLAELMSNNKGETSTIEYVIDEDIPPGKREIIRRQREMEEKLHKKGIILKCDKCGETRNVLPSGVYKGRFLCKKCEEYYKIKGLEEEIEDKKNDNVF